MIQTYDALNINLFELTPTKAIAEAVQQINAQLMLRFQFENINAQRTDEQKIVKEKNEHIQEIISALTWTTKQNYVREVKSRPEEEAK